MTARVWSVWVTTTDGADHAVTDEEMVAGMRAGKGLYLAVCGASVLAAAMTVPPGATCPHCVTRLRHLTHTSAPTVCGAPTGHGVRRRSGVLAWLVGLVRFSSLAAWLSRPVVSRRNRGALPRRLRFRRVPEPRQLYQLIVRAFVLHRAEDSTGMCRECGGTWPCEQVRLAYRLREGF
jgi:hypothetical protein